MLSQSRERNPISNTGENFVTDRAYEYRFVACDQRAQLSHQMLLGASQAPGVTTQGQGPDGRIHQDVHRSFLFRWGL